MNSKRTMNPSVDFKFLSRNPVFSPAYAALKEASNQHASRITTYLRRQSSRVSNVISLLYQKQNKCLSNEHAQY
jgi:hypothetical protein